MFRKIFICLSVSYLLFFTTSCIKTNSRDPQVLKLVMAEINPEGSISAEMDHVFKDKVEELSNNTIKIDLQTGATLGDEATVVNLMKQPDSSIQIARIAIFSLTSLGCKNTAMLTTPYIFNNRQQFQKFSQSPTADEILKEPYDVGAGLRGLFFGEEGFRHFISSLPVNSIDDFHGLTMRTSNDPIMQQFVLNLKSDYITQPFADIYASMKIGTINAAESPLGNYMSNFFYEVAPYIILNQHTLGITEVIISAEAWDALTPEQQNILLEAGKYAREHCFKISQEKENLAVAELKRKGVVFQEVTDFTPWKAACKNITDAIMETNPQLYQEILSYAQ